MNRSNKETKQTLMKMKNGSVVIFDENASKDPIYGLSNVPFYDPDDYQELGQLIKGQRDEEEE